MGDLKIRIRKRPVNWRWTFKMAFLDSRKSLGRLSLFTSSIILGIAALVAVNSFSTNLNRDLDRQSKELLGADLLISTNRTVPPAVFESLDSLKPDFSKEFAFASMVYFPSTDGTRLIQVRALEGDYPYYGSIETLPESAATEFRSGKMALVDETMLLQYGVSTGDSVKIGNVTFLIAGSLQKIPGQAGIVGTAAPMVFIPFSYLEETGLIKRGSRVRKRYYYQFEPGRDIQEVISKIKEPLNREGISYDTIDSRKENLGRNFANMDRFLNLVAFVALLLGCVGVASSVHVYVKDKNGIIAILRCLGAMEKQAFLVYLVQISVMGLIGSFIGAVLGSSIQLLIPVVLDDFIPVEVSFSWSWTAFLQGITIGFSMALLFALIPLLNIRKASPLQVLRFNFSQGSRSTNILKGLIMVLIVALVVLFIYWQGIGSLFLAFTYTGGLILAFLILAGIAQLVMTGLRRFFPTGWSYLWRQGLSNLFRPQNQTLILMVSIGLGTTLLTTLFLIQGMLIGEVTQFSTDEQPNVVLFDIQTEEKDSLRTLITEQGIPILQEVPVVTMRLNKVEGRNRQEVLSDTTLDVSAWVFNHEYRVTYRDTLIDSETLVSGGLPKIENGQVYISIEKDYANDLNLEPGDAMTLNIQGQEMEVRIAGTREVDWNRVQTNFLWVFPEGVLEQAPQFHVMMARVPSNQASATLQSEVVRAFPTVSVIDLGLILKTVDEILGKISFVIRFMAGFSLLTGLLILISSVLISRYQRIRESVLLRTLGARKKQILRITAVEYLILGSSASLTGIFLALAGGWALAKYSFEIPFQPDVLSIVSVLLIVTGITVIVGLLNQRSVVRRTPLEVLRKEA